MPVEFTPGLSDEQKRAIGLLPEDASEPAHRGSEPLRDLEDVAAAPPPPPPAPEPVPQPHSTPIEVPAALVTRINGAPEIKLRDGRRILRTDGTNAGELAAKKEEVIQGLVSRMGQLRSWAQQVDRGAKPNIHAGRPRRGQLPVDAWIETIAGIYREMGMENDVRTILRDFANAEGLMGDIDAKVRENKQKTEAVEKERLASSWKELNAIPAMLDAFDEMLAATPATGEKKREIVAILDGAVTSLEKLKADFSAKFERVDSVFVERAKLQVEALKDYFTRLYGTYGNTLPESLLDFTRSTLALILSSESRTAASGLLRGKRGVPTIAEMQDALNEAQVPNVKNLSEFCVVLRGIPEVPTNLGKDKATGKNAADFIRKEVVLGMESSDFAALSLEERAEKVEQLRSYFGTADGVLPKAFHKLLSRVGAVDATYRELFDGVERSINELLNSFEAFIDGQRVALGAALVRDKELRTIMAATGADAAAKAAATAELPTVTKKITETRATISDNFYKVAADLGALVKEERTISLKGEQKHVEDYCKKRYEALRIFQSELLRFSSLDVDSLIERLAAAMNGESWKDEAAPEGAVTLDAAEREKIRTDIANFNLRRTGKRTLPNGKEEWYPTDADWERAKREVTESQIKAHAEMGRRKTTLGKEEAKEKFAALFEGVTTKDALVDRLSGVSQGDALHFIKSGLDREVLVSSLRDEFLKQFNRFKDGEEFNARPKDQRQRIVVEYLNSVPATARRIFKPIFETELFSGERLEGVNMEKGAAGEPIPRAEAAPRPQQQPTAGEVVHSDLWKSVGEPAKAPEPTPAGPAAPVAGTTVTAPPQADTFKPTAELWNSASGSASTETPPAPPGSGTESAAASTDAEIWALFDQVQNLALPAGVKAWLAASTQAYSHIPDDPSRDEKLRAVVEKDKTALLPELKLSGPILRAHAENLRKLLIATNAPPEFMNYVGLVQKLASISEAPDPDVAVLFKGLTAYYAVLLSIEKNG